ncbi:MAG: hypothetical protein V3V08_17360 [Nannocystaceae bacterium]
MDPADRPSARQLPHLDARSDPLALLDGEEGLEVGVEAFVRLVANGQTGLAREPHTEGSAQLLECVFALFESTPHADPGCQLGTIFSPSIG